MRLIIVRHGETEDNVAGIVQGQTHGKLTEHGIRQAKEAGILLKEEKIEVVFSSDLDRTRHTAAEIVRFHQIPVHYVKELRERHAGNFQGRHRDEFYADEIASKMPKLSYRPKNGESLGELRKRMESFCEKIEKDYQNKCILLVTHGMVVRCLASIYLNVPLEETVKWNTRNAGILILEIEENKIKKVLDTLFF